MGYATGLSNKATRSDYAPHEIGDVSRSPSGSNVTANALFGLAWCVDQPEHNVRRSPGGNTHQHHSRVSRGTAYSP
jgi:hypothetical protein